MVAMSDSEYVFKCKASRTYGWIGFGVLEKEGLGTEHCKNSAIMELRRLKELLCRCQGEGKQEAHFRIY